MDVKWEVCWTKKTKKKNKRTRQAVYKKLQYNNLVEI